MRKTTSWGTYQPTPPPNGAWVIKQGHPTFYMTVSDSVTVHPYHGLEGLFVTCHAVRIEASPLKATDIEAAKREGLTIVRARLTTLLAALDAVEPPR